MLSSKSIREFHDIISQYFLPSELSCIGLPNESQLNYLLSGDYDGGYEDVMECDRNSYLLMIF